MATLLVGAAFSGISSLVGASAVLAPIISGVGVALGSFIDSQYVLPALFPPADIEGPRLSEIRTQFAEEGAPLNIGFGETVRTNGVVIWVSDLIEVRRETEVGGKGAPSQTAVSYEYLVSVAVAFAETRGVAISGIVEIVASGKILYRPNVSISFPSATVTAIAPFVLSGNSIWELTATGTGLGAFVAGGNVVLSGFVNGANNGTFQVIAATSDPGAGTSRLRLRNPAGVAEGPVTVTITQSLAAFNDSSFSSIEVYNGSTSQSPSPIIEAFQGIGNVPGHPGIAYFVIENLNLTRFGNILPQFNIIWNPGGGTGAGAMINRAAQIAGLGSSWANVASISYGIKGYPIQGVVDLSNALQPITLAGNLIEQASGSAIRFFPRPSAVILDIPADRLAAHDVAEEARERPINVQQSDEAELASSIVVRYLDSDNGFQGGSQIARAISDGVDLAQRVVNLPLVLSGSALEAQRIAQRLLFDSFNRRDLVRLSLDSSWYHIQPNDVLRVVALGRTWYLLVRRVDRGANHLVQIEATAEIRDAFVQVAAADPPGAERPEFFAEPHVTIAVPFDGPPIRPPKAPPTITPTLTPPRDRGIFVPFQHADRLRPSTIAEIYSAPERWTSTAEFVSHGIVTAEATLGRLVALPPNTAAISGDFADDAGTFEVELVGGSLASTVSEADWFAGRLAMLVGNEVIFCRTASLIGTLTYRLTGLLRGMLGTRGAIATHSLGEAVVLLSGGGIAESFIESSAAWIETCREFRAVPAGLSVSDVVGKVLKISDAGSRAIPPVDLASNRLPGGDVSLRWSRVGKEAHPAFAAAPLPLTPFARQRYSVRVLDPVDFSVVGTFVVLDSNHLTITQTTLTGLGIASTDAFKFTVSEDPEGFVSSGAGDAADIAAAPIP